MNSNAMHMCRAFHQARYQWQTLVQSAHMQTIGTSRSCVVPSQLSVLSLAALYTVRASHTEVAYFWAVAVAATAAATAVTRSMTSSPLHTHHSSTQDTIHVIY